MQIYWKCEECDECNPYPGRGVCESCGARMTAAAERAALLQREEEKRRLYSKENTYKKVEESRMKYCTHCGELLDDKAVFCPKCGVPQEGIKMTDDTCKKVEESRTRYCTHCGNPLDDKVAICPKCGVPQEGIKTTKSDSTDGWGWFFLGFWVPLCGLILYGTWISSRPNDAKKAGLGALIGTFIALLLVVKVIEGFS